MSKEELSNDEIVASEMSDREVSVQELVGSLETTVPELVQTSVAKNAIIVSQRREIESLRDQIKILKELLRTGSEDNG